MGDSLFGLGSPGMDGPLRLSLRRDLNEGKQHAMHWSEGKAFR